MGKRVVGVNGILRNQSQSQHERTGCEEVREHYW
jgi:hypothetical protein